MEFVIKQEIIDYIEERHLPDGGYCFARVEPSNGSDTYYAVRTLRLLETKIKNMKSIAEYFSEGNLSGLASIFFAVETYKEMQISTEVFKKYARQTTDPKDEPRLDYSMDYQCAHDEDLRNLFYLAVLSRDLKFSIDEKKTNNFIYSIQNENGGFGHKVDSKLMAAYYSLNALAVLSMPVKNKKKTLAFIMDCLNERYYLENMFYAVGCLGLMGEPMPDVEGVAQFVSGCQRNDGGFSRAWSLGVSTIEHTYMAVSVLKKCEEAMGEKIIK